MDWEKTLIWLRGIMEFELFHIGTTPITPGSLVVVIGMFVGALVLSRGIRKVIDRVMKRRKVKDEVTQTLKRLTHYVIMIFALLACLQAIGIDLSTLFAAGAVFAVGLGFAMQNIVQNFVSGIILLVEQSIKIGDILEIEEGIVQVQQIGIRSTVVRTRNEVDVIVPNSILAQGMVKNYTFTNASYLLEAQVGVTYDSDMKQVKAVLEKVARSVDWRDVSQEPRVLMRQFGTSSVDFGVFVWVSEPWLARRLHAFLNESIWFALKEADITIAFPQLDLHLDKNVEKSLSLIAGNG